MLSLRSAPVFLTHLKVSQHKKEHHYFAIWRLCQFVYLFLSSLLVRISGWKWDVIKFLRIFTQHFLQTRGRGYGKHEEVSLWPCLHWDLLWISRADRTAQCLLMSVSHAEFQQNMRYVIRTRLYSVGSEVLGVFSIRFKSVTDHYLKEPANLLDPSLNSVRNYFYRRGHAVA
jgi:hypothetical protein